jgi:Mg2+-importing ATPase
LGSSEAGLSEAEAKRRLARHGPNALTAERPLSAWRLLARQFTSPLVLLLLLASTLAFALGDHVQTSIIIAMVVLAALLAFVQEYRSHQALEGLRRRLTHHAEVVRDGRAGVVDARDLVPGDLVLLVLGAVVPADLRLLSAEGLEIDEAVITGESLPVVKSTAAIESATALPQQQTNIAFQGTGVVQGRGRGVVVATGAATELGRTAALLSAGVGHSDFEQGVARFGQFLLWVTVAMCAVVAVVLGLLRGEWAESVLFSLALAVGIAPELLPVVTTINLSRGALAMSRKQVLVRRLTAIEDLGNVDVICTDKTGTLTIAQLQVQGGVDPFGRPSRLPLREAAHCLDIDGTGFGGAIDRAIGAAAASGDQPSQPEVVRRASIPFDFERRRMSVVVGRPLAPDRLITKGAVAEVLDRCIRTTVGDQAPVVAPLDQAVRSQIEASAARLQAQGHRLVAVARRDIAPQESYGQADEVGLDLVGFILLSDVPKESARQALQQLAGLGVTAKLLTGDTPEVARQVAARLDFPVTELLTGEDLAGMDDAQLARAASRAEIFARITPAQKLRVVEALKAAGHAVGFMGDGINDGPALRAADVGISFEDATDVAKDAAGVVLLQKDLLVLADGITEGRRIFANTRTYIHATIASNFGNMLSVAGAALLLPFIPLLPAQILLLNLLSDLPMLAISSDRVPDEELARPSHWNVHEISNTMFFFGTISSLADFATFGLLLVMTHVNVVMFRSGWFVESMLTELVVIYLLRTRGPFWRSRPSAPLLWAGLATLMATALLLASPLAIRFGLAPLPAPILAAVVLIVIGYMALTELGKRAFYRLQRPTMS